MTLTNHQKPAASGTADSLVIFLHGFGADGKDLLGLADPLAEHLPNAMFMAPDAPNSCSVNPMGYEWFPIPMIDGSTIDASLSGRDAAAVTLNMFLDEVAKETGISADRTVLIGFSQGTMMSLHVAARRTTPVAGVVGFSGRLVEPEKLEDEMKSKMPILLIHGDQDDVVPYSDMGIAADALTKAGFETYTHTSKGTAHGIAPDGLGMALGFIHKVLGMG